MSVSNSLISVVIVNWNGETLLRQCLQSVIDQKYAPLEIILVDNASTDASGEIVHKEFPQAHIIQNQTNMGFAHGCNQGLQRASGTYVLFLNTDAWLHQHFFQPLLLRFEKEPALAAIGPKLLNANNPTTLDGCGSFWSITTWLYHVGYLKDASEKTYSKPRYFFALKGAVLLVRREHMERINGFDDSFWCYYEDTDICHRFWLAGLSCIYDPAATAYHIGGASAAHMHNALLHFHNFKNQLQSFIKNFSLSVLAWVLPIHILFMFGISGIWLFQGKIRHATSVYRAIGWTLYHLPEILRKRTIVQHLRTIDDSVYLSSLTKNPSINYIVHNFIPSIKYADE